MTPRRPHDDDTPEAWLDIPNPLTHLAKGPPNTPSSSPFSSASAAVPSLPTRPSPTRRDTKLRRAAALGLAVTWVVALLVQAGLRPGFAANAGFVMAQVTLWSFVLAVALSLAMAPGRHGLGADLRWTGSTAVLAPVGFMLLALVWLVPRSSGSFGEVGALAPLSNCFTYALLVAVPTTLLAAWSLRRAFPAGAAWRGAAIGAACGLSSALVLTLHCASPLGGHIALAHGLPIAVSVVLGALLVGRWGRA